MNTNVTQSVCALKAKTRINALFEAEAGISQSYDIPMSTACPICKRPVDPLPRDSGAFTPKYYPFCSERCKLIDLGRWLDGKYQVPVVEDDLDEGGVEERD